MARLRRASLVFPLHPSSRRSTSAAGRYFGKPAAVQLATLGTELARFVSISPRWWRNRKKPRSAVTVRWAVLGLVKRARCSTYCVTSREDISAIEAGRFPKHFNRNVRVSETYQVIVAA